MLKSEVWGNSRPIAPGFLPLLQFFLGNRNGFIHESCCLVTTCGFSPQEARLAENACTLADLTEGQVGKLLIRKSGKVQLLLGKVTLDVTMGTTCSFLQVRPRWARERLGEILNSLC
jgi:hypothetical protein